MELENTLKERSEQHGDFWENAGLTERLLDVARDGRNYQALSAVKKTALFFILHKTARILAGDPNHVDHWHDIAGYAKLAEDEASTCKKRPTARKYALCPHCACEIPVTVPSGRCPECLSQLV